MLAPPQTDGMVRPMLSRMIAAAGAVTALLASAGCGQGSTTGNPAVPVLGAPSSQSTAAADLGYPGFATKNTTRVGGGDPVADAAAVARAVYVAASANTRPQVVVLADDRNWPGALAASVLMSRPLRAPILLAHGNSLPAATQQALRDLSPSGAPQAGGAQVIRVGTQASVGSLRVRQVSGATPFAVAAAIDRLASEASGSSTGQVVVVPSTAPAFAMPAAGWAAKSGDPVLFVTPTSVPAETMAAIHSHPGAHLYVLGPLSVVGKEVTSALRPLGKVTRISAPDPVASAVAFARFTDGHFGWGVTDPGHGLVFANATRPLDAAAAAPLSASGSYGPLLVTDSAIGLPSALDGYLRDIQPGYDKDPARGFYNHAWLIGDRAAISLTEQASIDALLEIAPVSGAGPTAPGEGATGPAGAAGPGGASAPIPAPSVTGPTGASGPARPHAHRAHQRSPGGGYPIGPGGLTGLRTAKP